MSDLVLVLKYVSYGSSMTPVILFLLVKNFQLKYLNLFIALSVCSFLSDTLCLIFINQKKSIESIVNLQDVIQFVMIVLLYWKFLLKNDEYFKVRLKYLLLFYFLATAFFWKGLSGYQNFSWTIASISTMLIAMRHVHVISKTQIFGIAKFGPFWISAGLIIYCSLAISLIAMLNYMEQRLGIRDFWATWMFHNVTLILKNFCFLLAVWYASNTNPPLAKRFFSDN
jgi:hypothetical protein